MLPLLAPWLLYPANVPVHREYCFSETGGNDRHCFHDGQPNNGIDFTKGINLSTYRDPARNMELFCVTGKNWSHNRERWFEVRR